ncbi:hypothetical protein KVV02_002962 [Mortierella alpina]|uniref:CDC20/Fizzy WD40 domain-containing protein n=1 Tax=Mortierella alpina TaxID=64518 RepID=A0A9P8A759_MORAP|nr:hypothetical protein KVV02_002962 [Mortierella alpina]
MDAQFKKRVQAVQQSESSRPTVTPDDASSATRHRQHQLPHHHPGLVSPTSAANNHTQATRTTGGPIRTAVSAGRSTRARGPPGTPTGGSGFSSSGRGGLFGHHGSAQSALLASPHRPLGIVSPSAIGARRSSGAGVVSTAAGSSTPVRKTARTNNNTSNTPNGGSNNSNENNVLGSSSNTSHSNTNSSHINIRNGARQSTPPRNTEANASNIPSNAHDNLPGTGSSNILRSPGMMSPSKKRVYDRFIPVREGGLSEHFDLLPDTPATPSRQRTRNMSMTPNHSTHSSDLYKKAQSQAHDAVLANELMLTHSTHDPSLPPSTPRRLFAYASTTTHNTMHFDSPSRQIYAPTPVTQESRSILLSPKKAPRAISKVPFKVLDAPELKDDFYLNLVDWSSQNVLGVGLGSCVYLWSALTSKVTQLCDLGETDNVTSISWISMGSHLAVGTDKGTIQIWDVQNSRRVRTMTGHTQRVGVLAWSDHTLTSGSRDRNIYHRDVRSQEMWEHRLSSHTGEVCGLKWNSSGTQLASGGNDNKLMVWEKDSVLPLYKFRDHTAAVKAIDWNPHQSGVLASGGGTADRHIRFWNTSTGTAISATDTGSQVCNLAWSKTTNELVSTHGYSQNQVLVWKYPSMQQIASLSGHSLRVLYLALSPDGQTIVTGAGDETLRFWNVFQKSKSERRDDDGLADIVSTIR